MKVSLIIPTYNKLPRLKLVMASLLSQNYPVNDYEVIIVDDGSTDGTSEYFADLDVQYDLNYIQTSNRGRSAARNKGIECAKHQLILFSDDDMILSPDFITEHVKLQNEGFKIAHGKVYNLSFLKFFLDPTKGILFPELKSGGSQLDDLKSRSISESDVINRFNEIIGSCKKMTSLELAIMQILNEKIAGSAWISFVTNNISLPKRWIEVAGGFEEKFAKRWGAEDFELGYRLYLEGYEFRYCEKAVNYHIVHYHANFQTDLEENFKVFHSKYNEPGILTLFDYLNGKTNRESFINMLRGNELLQNQLQGGMEYGK